MEKIKTSMKICYRFNKIWRCGYCDLQTIFQHYRPTYYNCGVYGWNCDLYIDYEHDAIITTGYRNMRGERIPDELIKKYDKKAHHILNKYDYTQYEKRKTALLKNADRFLEELNNL